MCMFFRLLVFFFFFRVCLHISLSSMQEVAALNNQLQILRMEVERLSMDNHRQKNAIQALQVKGRVGAATIHEHGIDVNEEAVDNEHAV